METEKLKRYYFHGDVAEHDSKLIFCAAHDSFETMAHFYDIEQHPASGKNDYQRYLQAKKAFSKKGISLPKGFYRPTGVVNVFA